MPRPVAEAPVLDAPLTETQTRSERETWAELMRVTFQLDVLARPRCGGRLRHIATIIDASAARKLLEHLGLPARASGEIADCEIMSRGARWTEGRWRL